MPSIEQTRNNTAHQNPPFGTVPPGRDDNGREYSTVEILQITAAVGVFSLALFVLIDVIKVTCEYASDYFNKHDLNDLETKIKDKKIPQEVIEHLKNLESVRYKYVAKKLAFCSDDEAYFIKYLSDNYEITPQILEKILRGAYVQLSDEGESYGVWSQDFLQKRPRISSHPSMPNLPQYGLSGEFVSELLYGKNLVNNREVTWFQLERNPVRFGHINRHLLDYVRYKFTGHNQGPYGSTIETHNNPLILNPKIKV